MFDFGSTILCDYATKIIFSMLFCFLDLLDKLLNNGIRKTIYKMSDFLTFKILSCLFCKHFVLKCLFSL